MEIDFRPNPKQGEFFELAIDALFGKSENRHLWYGGGIRGGKTFVSLCILSFAAKHFPNSRWFVFRKDMPALLSTTIPSMVKIIDGNPNWVWTRSAGNYHVTYKPSGGKIFFKGENLAQDPELTDLLGLECNGILFEQVEELSPKLFQLGCSRLGSWLLEKMPMPITLATCNPSQTWVKEMIYEPYTRNELPEAHIFMPALPRDNKFVTEEQWKQFNRMSDNYKRIMIEGDWTDLMDLSHRWAYR